MIDLALFHKLWGKAVGTNEYDKREWETLQSQITDANTNPEPTTFGSQTDEQILFDARHGTSYGMK